jgi:hypothetical protein
LFIVCKMILKTHYHHHHRLQQQQTNNNVTNYAQTPPEDATITVTILADKQKTDPSYIIQDEETRDFEQSTKKWIPTLYCVCESAQPNNHHTAGGHRYRKYACQVNA